jgi:hypothetical protein
MEKLEKILDQRPRFHRGETEIERSFTTAESFLSKSTVERLSGKELTCYGIEKDVLSFIADHSGPGLKTLETGAGCSTLVFALSGSDHIAITPSLNEIELIKRYGKDNDIPMDKIRFIAQPSEAYLPLSDAMDLDIVLLDGKHAFPWPIVDWFFTADKLKQDGLMIIDDVEMRPVAILIDFMKSDAGWEMVRNFSGKTVAFKKNRALVHDVAWHMQRYSATGAMQKISGRIKKMVKW